MGGCTVIQALEKSECGGGGERGGNHNLNFEEKHKSNLVIFLSCICVKQMVVGCLVIM